MWTARWSTARRDRRGQKRTFAATGLDAARPRNVAVGRRPIAARRLEVLAGPDAPIDSLAEHYKNALRADRSLEPPSFPAPGDDPATRRTRFHARRRDIAARRASRARIWDELSATVQADDHPLACA